MNRFAAIRKAPVALALSLSMIGAATMSAHADWQPNTNIGAAKRGALATALDQGTPEALRHYLDSYPDSPESAKVLEMLIQACSKILQGAPGSSGSIGATCDLSDLIAPAAGPGTTVQGFTDPPTENSGGNRASPN
jgi:hypothetical protein